MTKDEAIAWIQEQIEEVQMRAQGIGDGFMPDHDPRELAEDIFDTARRASSD